MEKCWSERQLSFKYFKNYFEEKFENEEKYLLIAKYRGKTVFKVYPFVPVILPEKCRLDMFIY